MFFNFCLERYVLYVRAVLLKRQLAYSLYLHSVNVTQLERSRFPWNIDIPWNIVEYSGILLVIPRVGSGISRNVRDQRAARSGRGLLIHGIFLGYSI